MNKKYYIFYRKLTFVNFVRVMITQREIWEVTCENK